MSAIAHGAAAHPCGPEEPITLPEKLPLAAKMEGVTFVPKQDSVRVSVPQVAGAKDYRIFVVNDKVGVEIIGNNERINNAEIYCAGQQQANAPALPDLPNREIQVDGIYSESTIVVEAIDRACPFPGLMSLEHSDQVVFEGDDPAEIVPFSVWTPEESKSYYGSVYHNGHGVGAVLGARAERSDPVVLARAVLSVAPKQPELLATWHDFQKPGQVQKISAASDAGRSQKGALYRDDDFNYYAYGNQWESIFKRDGVLHVAIADWHQDIFGQVYFVPKKPVELQDDTYLHSTYEVASNTSARRYWWWFVCGSDKRNDTLNADGTLKSPIVQSPFFYQADGRNPSVSNWNCLQLFTLDGSPFPIGSKNPQSDMRVMINRAGIDRGSVVNVSPKQYAVDWMPRSWYVQQDGAGKLGGTINDDKLGLNTQRTAFDVYLSRNRIVVYVDGEQRICNDFGAQALTMHDAALGYGQVLYHSAAERNDFTRSYYDKSGQKYWLNNTPYADERTWDNIGNQQSVKLPKNFDVSKCYKYVP